MKVSCVRSSASWSCPTTGMRAGTPGPSAPRRPAPRWARPTGRRSTTGSTTGERQRLRSWQGPPTGTVGRSPPPGNNRAGAPSLMAGRTDDAPRRGTPLRDQGCRAQRAAVQRHGRTHRKITGSRGPPSVPSRASHRRRTREVDRARSGAGSVARHVAHGAARVGRRTRGAVGGGDGRLRRAPRPGRRPVAPAGRRRPAAGRQPARRLLHGPVPPRPARADRPRAGAARVRRLERRVPADRHRRRPAGDHGRRVGGGRRAGDGARCAGRPGRRLRALGGRLPHRVAGLATRGSTSSSRSPGPSTSPASSVPGGTAGRSPSGSAPARTRTRTVRGLRPASAGCRPASPGC